MIKKKVISVMLVLTLVMGFFTACKKDDDGLKKVKLCEVAHSIFYAPQYVAIEKGYFKEEGIKIKLVNGAGADKVMTSVLSGESDIGFMGSEASIYVYQQGEKDYIVNFAGLTQRAGNFLVARDDKAFKWEDLKGKTVLGGREGGMPEMIFEYILKKKGIDPEKDLTIVKNIDFGLTAGAFSSGQGDYTVEFEPFATGLEKEKDGYVIASLGEESGYVPYTAYSAKKSYIEDNKDTIRAFTKAIQKGLDYVNTHSSEEIAKVIKPQFKETSMDDLVTIIDRYKQQDTWKTTTEFTKDSFELLQDILWESKVLEDRVPYEDLVNTEFSK